MKGLMKKIFTLSLGLILISCQNDLPEDSMQNVVKSENESFPIHVVYEGKDYYSQCQLLGDSLVIENEFLANLIDELFLKNENVQTYVHDGVIEYFDNQELMESKYESLSRANVIESSNLSTRSDEDLKNADGYAIVWEDQDYKGWSMPFWANYGGQDHWDIDKPDNDKISSLEVYLNTVGMQSNLECFEDNGYKGLKLTVSTSVITSSIIDGANRIPNLKKIPRGRKNWGDAISSLRFSITDVGLK